MKKLLFALSMACLIFACSKSDQLSNSPVIDALSEEFDNSNFGNYKGVFTTLDSETRATVDVSITPNGTLATLTTEAGQVHEFYSMTDILQGELTAVRFEGPAGSFNFEVDADGDNVAITEVMFLDKPADIYIKKGTAKGPVVTAITGSYFCNNCESTIIHPVFVNNDVEETFNFVISGGNVTTQITYNGNVYNDGSGIASQDVTDIYDGGVENGITDGTGYKSISGSSWVLNQVIWEGIHNFSTAGTDRSVVQGTWSFVTGSGTMTGIFYAQSSNSVTAASELLPGDLVLVRAYSDDSSDAMPIADLLSIAATVDITDGASIDYTDKSWLGTALRSGEGTQTITASGLTKGSIQSFASGLTITSSGDQVHIYVDDGAGSPRFIFSATWAAGVSAYTTGAANSTNETQLPSGLVEGVTAFYLGTTDNHAITGPSLSLTKAAFLNHLSASGNYTASSSPQLSTVGITSLTITN